jgi:hypothetical protein
VRLIITSPVLFVYVCGCVFVFLAAVVVAVLRAVGSQSAGVAEKGCGAILNLALSNDTNKTALGAAGACEGGPDSTGVYCWGRV